MLKDELLSLFNGKNIPKKQQKAAKIEFQEIRGEHQEIQKQLKAAKKAKDTAKMAVLTSKLDLNLERELRLESENKVQVKFRNTELDLDRSHIQKLKNPDKYVNKLYFNKSFKQVDKLIKQGKETEAKGLLKILSRSKDALVTDDKKEREIEKKIDSYIDDNLWDKNEIEGEEEELYDALFSSGGSSITVTTI